MIIIFFIFLQNIKLCLIQLLTVPQGKKLSESVDDPVPLSELLPESLPELLPELLPESFPLSDPVPLEDSCTQKI